MTAGQFWDEDPWLAEAYREAAEYQAQRKSWEMWLQGVYFFNAVSTALGNAFRKKGAKPVNYMAVSYTHLDVYKRQLRPIY